jgi:hypothetical protein
MSDTAIAVGRQEAHLIFPGVGAQRPAMAEEDRLSCAPVFVVEINVTGILFADSNVGQDDSPLFPTVVWLLEPGWILSFAISLPAHPLP